MRFFAVITSLALAGCVSTSAPSEFRPPASDSERRAYEADSVTAARVIDILWKADANLCSGCVPHIQIAAANGVGAYADADAIHLSIPLFGFLKNDDEIAVVMGHEWAHQILGHIRAGGGFDATREIAADCVGALLAERAGYNAAIGAESHRRMGAADTRQAIVLAAFGIFGGDAKLDWDLRYRTVAGAHMAVRPITKETIARACGVRW